MLVSFDMNVSYSFVASVLNVYPMEDVPSNHQVQGPSKSNRLL